MLNIKSESLIIFFVLSFFFFTSNDRLLSQNTSNTEDWGLWRRRIILTSKYLGPNALPVPDIRQGNINPDLFLDLAGFAHFSSYDRSYNPYFRLSLPFAKGNVSIEVWSDLFEYFDTDSASLSSRNGWSKETNGFSGGDIYVASLFQLVKNHNYLPDMLLSINLKTASGGKVEALRHTDTPGYYFDLSIGKDIPIKGKIILRPYGLIGFYAYQTNRIKNLQNDAPHWGGGCKLAVSRLSLSGCIGGYRGYFEQGDRPIVVRFIAELSANKFLTITTGFQQGMQDFEYSTFNIGIRFQIPMLEMPISSEKETF